MPKTMTSRERFRLAMAHRRADRVPLDLGGTSLTGMRPAAQQRLAELLGFGPATEADKGHKGFDERLLRWAGTDFRGLGQLVHLPNVHARTISATAFVNDWGCRHELIDGEWQLTGCPLAQVKTIADVRNFPWPQPRVDEAELRRYAQQAQRLKAAGEFVVVAEHPICGVMEMGCWMFGYNRYLEAIALEPEIIDAFSEKIWQIQEQVITQYYAAVGPYIDLTINGDDFGTQTGPFLSGEMFDARIAPWFKARIDLIKKLVPGCLFWHHTCGSVFGILDNILRCGVDILNPIQTSAHQMEPALLKQTFGERVVFWGAMDVQQFLPKATPAQVRKHARWLIDTLGQDGGYVMAGAHEILDDVPAENVVAWVEVDKRG